MKKTLIALAVAASAAVSGSAMAWTANGTGGNVDLGGTLTPADVVTPWEVQVGDAVTGLNALIQKGQKTVEIKATSAIPVLGIRSADVDGFKGKGGINPQIDYNDVIDLDGFRNGVTTLTLPVKNASEEAIGTMEAPLFASASLTYRNNNGQKSRLIAASEPGRAFFGGLGKSSSAIMTSGGYERMVAMYPEVAEKFTVGSGWISHVLNESFSDTAVTYWGVYGSGIESGQTITITLDNAATGNDAIEWKASLPVTVTYA